MKSPSSGLACTLAGSAALASLLLCAPGFGSPRNSDTDWFNKAGYGVFVHYLEDLQNAPQQIQSLGKRTSWDECVREFDARRFADTMAEAGAGYVIFTLHQRTRFLVAPNQTGTQMAVAELEVYE